MKRTPPTEHAPDLAGHQARSSSGSAPAPGKQTRTARLPGAATDHPPVQMRAVPATGSRPAAGEQTQDDPFGLHLLGAAPATSVPTSAVQMQKVDDGGTPGYLEETGFGSLAQVKENRKRYEEGDWPSVADREEYVPDLGVPEKQRRGMSPEEIGRTDLDEELETNDLLRDRVGDASEQLDLDPGQLAATLFAEYSDPDMWSGTSGKVESEMLGLDDWFDPTMASYIKKVLKENPDVDFKYTDVKATGETWDTSTEKAGGAAKPRGEVDANKAVMAAAIYQKAQQKILERVIELERKKHPEYPTLDELQPDQRLTLLRLTFNAGIGNAKKLYKRLATGGDIARKGGTQRDPKRPGRTAVLHTARAIHLSQHVFGRSPDDYRP